MEQDTAQLRKYALRWAMLFVVLIALMGGVLWWSSAALEFSASRIKESTRATYKVKGVVIDRTTGRPVAWAGIEDDPQSRPPRFRTSTDHTGHFELLTVAEPHRLIVTALGYQAGSHRTGKDWYLWMPKGEEEVRIEIEPEE
jgi:hypothetical protein